MHISFESFWDPFPKNGLLGSLLESHGVFLKKSGFLNPVPTRPESENFQVVPKLQLVYKYAR